MQAGKLDAYSTYLYHQGNNSHSYMLFGAHLVSQDGVSGVRFAVWAPHAQKVSVTGDFNNWQAGANPLSRSRFGNGIWETFVPGLQPGATYKYAVTAADGRVLLKSDPYALTAEVRPATASKVADLTYAWQDEEWRHSRRD